MKQILSLLCVMVICAMTAISCSDNDDDLTKTFTVTFDSQGGSAVSAQTVSDGAKATQPTAPTKEGVKFGGWYTEAAYTHAWDFEKNIVTTDITLYARWTSKTFTVKFDTNGGNSIEDMEVADGGLIATLPIPTNTDKAFDGWYTDKTYKTKFAITTPITDNITLYAKWIEVSKDALKKLVKETYELNSNNYTEESYNKMIQKRTAAEKILDKENPTEKEITTAYQDLSKAISELVALTIRPTVALSIYPQPINNVIYLNPAIEYFEINAYGIDSEGDNATNNKVIFEYDKNELETWAMDRTAEEIEEGMKKIEETDTYLLFTPKANLAADKTTTITIKSADNTTLSQTITLKIISSADAKSKFIAAVNALPATSTVTFDNFEEYEVKVQEMYSYYNNIPEENKDQNVSTAYDKLAQFNNDIYFNKISYRFEGNTCIIYDERYTYTPDGAFPVGTYASISWEDDSNESPEYSQERMILYANGTYQTEYRISTNPNGTNATPWIKESSGEYKSTGNQTNGGTIILHETWNIDDEETFFAKKASASRAKKVQSMKLLKR